MGSGASAARNAFPGNIIPANRLDPNAVKLLSLLPPPTQPGFKDNFNINRGSTTDVNQFDIRIDENISSKDSIFGRYSWSRSPTFIPGPFTGYADGGGFGEQVFIFPSTGNETVLDAIGRIYGLPPVSSKKRIWVARPAPSCVGCFQILPVDWRAITRGAQTDTNYQVFPGDRIYVEADRLIWLDNTLAKILAPVERVFGVTLLGASTVQSIKNLNSNTAFGTPVIVP